MNDNILYNIGDSLVVKVSPQITGRVRFTNIIETIVGETNTRRLIKTFRISTDNIFWSEWQDFTIDNLGSKSYVTENSLFIEIRYVRVGTDATGEIKFEKVEFDGTHEDIEFVAPTLFNSIFGKLVGTSELQSLEQNIFKKLYHRGIIPKYITRGDNMSYEEDKDYVDFFYAVARFFALILRFFKRWENFVNDEELLREQIRGYNIFFNESNIKLSQLQYLASRMLSTIQQRGTEMIFVREGDKLPNGSNAEVDGEAIRLIRSRVCDEIVYDAMPTYKIGWCLGNVSPLYRGTSRSYNLNKTPENMSDFVDVNKYVLDGNCTLSDSSGKKVISVSGAGGIKAVGDVRNKLIVMDSQMDYEVTFAFKVNTSGSAKLHFGVRGYDILKRELADAFIHQDYRQLDTKFFEEDLSNFKEGIWYFARGIIHAYDTRVSDKVKTNLGFGQNLVFNNYFTKYVFPEIYTDGGEIEIWDYKVRPLVRGKNIIPLKDGSSDSRSVGFIQAPPFFYTYFRNSNNSQSVEEIVEIMEHYLYPFNSINLFTILSNS